MSQFMKRCFGDYNKLVHMAKRNPYINIIQDALSFNIFKSRINIFLSSYKPFCKGFWIITVLFNEILYTFSNHAFYYISSRINYNGH